MGREKPMTTSGQEARGMFTLAKSLLSDAQTPGQNPPRATQRFEDHRHGRRCVIYPPEFVAEEPLKEKYDTLPPLARQPPR